MRQTFSKSMSWLYWLTYVKGVTMYVASKNAPELPLLNDESFLHLIHRANGDVTCIICGKKYYDHPVEDRVLGMNDEPFLKRICNGQDGTFWYAKL